MPLKARTGVLGVPDLHRMPAGILINAIGVEGAMAVKTRIIQSPSFATDQQRWQAVVARDARADGLFYFSVKTTGIYCRSTCPSRRALRKNVAFFKTCEEAEYAGFRACKRCKPRDASLAQRHVAIVEKACRLIEEAETAPTLDELAKEVGMSTFHLHRVFKAQTGLTPKQYATAHRSHRVRSELDRRQRVTDAIYGSGFSSSSRFYETSSQVLGMTPKDFRAGGNGTAIRFAVGHCWLGEILVAASDKGVCAILFGDDPDKLVRDMQDRFTTATLIGGDKRFEKIVATVVGLVSNPVAECDLPLDIRGTVFQQRVWEALRRIPPGTTASYSEIAKRIGEPRAVRAVAQACAKNMLAVAIPCHRVVRTDGSLSGYRWGAERKERLIQRERELA
jgi:AraC family transcriptional regulator, regulatory protein of adaptative response / methylated-DNA-[protein]-cysteine methyltransferase